MKRQVPDIAGFVRRLLGLGLVLGFLSACTDTLQFIERKETRRATGHIVKIDADARRLYLRGGGRRLTLRVNSDHARFDQLQVGDKLDIRFLAGVRVSLAKAGVVDTRNQRLYRLGDGGDGRNPEIALVEGRTVVAEFVDFDHRTRQVVMKLADDSYVWFFGWPAMQTFAASRSLGDKLVFVSQRAIAVSIVPRR